MESCDDAIDISSNFSEPEGDSGDEHLYFSKLSNDLRALFSRNKGNEDFCDHIYEDTYTSSCSGRFSYYTDILAMAQLKDCAKATRNSAQDHRKERSTPPESKFTCSWKCSGYQDTSLGTGPLEDLFSVLNPIHPNFVSHYNLPSTSTASETVSWQISDLNADMFPVGSFEDGYSDFVDVFNRWSSSDIFPLDFQPDTNNG